MWQLLKAQSDSNDVNILAKLLKICWKQSSQYSVALVPISICPEGSVAATFHWAEFDRTEELKH